ncbi:DUF443 family protein, partial [Staphylococcus aureus]|uniref:DUF443 family protein n=2 Tax=Staphylococcus aureus TaxID=1280 RepID=UPI0021B5283E
GFIDINKAPFKVFIFSMSTLKGAFHFGGFSFFTLYALITIDVQNIIIFICWGAVTMFFFFINIVPIGIKKAHVILLKKAE